MPGEQHRPGDPTGRPPLRRARAGDLVLLKEADYRYGRGDLRLRLTSVSDEPTVYDHVQWVQVEGTEIRLDGSSGPHRQVHVRLSALRRR